MKVSMAILTHYCLMLSFPLTIAQWKTETLPDRQTYVHLFEWKWTDIANECETFLGKYKYGAVQVSPPNEHIMLTKTVNNVENVPWWVRYQPVSYNLTRSRSGTLQEFKDMVARCNKVGVRIIVDAVINHMTGISSKYPGQWGTYSSAGNQFDANTGSFPGVPYGQGDFHNSFCNEDIRGSDYQNDAWRVRMCRLSSLIDLDQGKEYVRQKIADYMNSLIDLGVVGFRIDAAKHMWPDDLRAILAKVKNLRTDIITSNDRPFLVLEIIDYGGEAVKTADYLNIGRVTNFKYGRDVSDAVRKTVLQSGSIQNFKWFTNFGQAWSYTADDSTLVFIDNHDTQRDGSPPLTYKDGSKYIMAVTFMLAWPYAYPSVMSSFNFTAHDQGCPTNGPGTATLPTWDPTTPQILADETCSPTSGWVCEHRWPPIRRMTYFRGITQDQAVADPVPDEHRIAFRRGNKGFFALNNNDAAWTNQFTTGLPAGKYCDVISGEKKNSACTGTTVTVDSNGKASITLASGKTLAIHVDQRL